MYRRNLRELNRQLNLFLQDACRLFGDAGSHMGRGRSGGFGKGSFGEGDCGHFDPNTPPPGMPFGENGQAPGSPPPGFGFPGFDTPPHPGRRHHARKSQPVPPPPHTSSPVPEKEGISTYHTKSAAKLRGRGLVRQVLGLLLGIPVSLLWATSILGAALSGMLFSLPSFVFSLLTLPIASWGLWISASGRRAKKLSATFLRYLEIIGGASFYEVSKLAASTATSADLVRKNLTKMLRAGLFQEAFMDEQRTCLILDRSTYAQYLRLQAQKDAPPAAKVEPAATPKTPTSDVPDEVRRMVEAGAKYVRQIKEANDALPGEEVSNALFRLETVTTNIFKAVERRPEKAGEIRRLMDYHLPTTLKLVNTYRDLDAQAVQGENTRAARKEILSALDTVNAAFENLLDKLYQDLAFDVSSDISVLKAMLSQEGLTQNDDFHTL